MKAKQTKTKTYQSKTPTYKIYQRLKAAGQLSKKWGKSYDSFLQDVGERPAGYYTLETINPKNGYKLGNVRWVTRQMIRSKTVTINGVTKSLARYAEEAGEDVRSFTNRFNMRVKKLGWSEEKALKTPANSGRKRDVYMTINGENKSLVEWSKETGISYGVLYHRKKTGWPEEKMLMPLQRNEAKKRLIKRPKSDLDIEKEIDQLFNVIKDRVRELRAS